jgi:DNA-binding NarL/FixJ family response regulator
MSSCANVPPTTETSPTLRILVVDDHPQVRDAVTRTIETETDMQVVGEAADGPAAMRLCDAVHPTVALVDVSMPGWSGVKLTELITRTYPQVKVIAFTRHREEAFVDAMLQAGAAGYVLKHSPIEELTRAVRAVAAGARYIDRYLAAHRPAGFRLRQ